MRLWREIEAFESNGALSLLCRVRRSPRLDPLASFARSEPRALGPAPGDRAPTGDA